MNKKTIIFGTIGVVVLLGAAYFFYGPGSRDRMVVVDVKERIENEALELSFEFESGEDALGFSQSAPNEFEGTSLLQAYVLMDNEARTFYQNNTEATEAPPAISVLVFARTEEDDAAATGTPKRTAEQKVRDWATANSGFTNINLALTEIEEVEIDGAPGIHYTSDGLYAQDTYVVKYGDKMYLFVGQYIDASDDLHTQFQEIVNSVLFL